MDKQNYLLASELIGKSYIQLGQENLNTLSKQLRVLLSHRRLPPEGWSEILIEYLMRELSLLDSNTYINRAGVGEREGRTICPIVERRYFSMTHGIGRSGDLDSVQPKAAGSSLMYKLSKYMTKHALEIAGLRVQECIVLPVATGMALTLVLLTLKKSRPVRYNQEAKYVIWSRIDQKTCLKCISSAGYEPIVLETRLDGDRVSMGDIEECVGNVNPKEILCVLSTTSCFAPRAPDDVERISRVCKEFDIPHVINNAYGLQCSKISQQITQAMRLGRVDAIIQSTDKNFLVPVGGSIVASNSKPLIKELSELYPGRATASPIMDLFMTYLWMGEKGYRNILKERKRVLKIFIEKLRQLAEKHNERFLEIPGNTISYAITLTSLTVSPTELGSALFTRRVTGARVINPITSKTVCGICFGSYGASYTNYPVAYMTAACPVGLKEEEIELFLDKLDGVLWEYKVR